MSHQIEEFDLTLSTEGTEWHGLAEVVDPSEILTRARDLCFPIREMDVPPITVPALDAEGRETGETVAVPFKDPETGKGWKVIAADCRRVPANEKRASALPPLVPLHIPKQTYRPIDNGRILDTVLAGFIKAGLPVELSTVGTLANLARFYFSLSTESFKVQGPKGDEIQSYITGQTWHNGDGNVKLHDSHIRAVCANTADAIMGSHGSLSLAIPHRGDTDALLVDFEEQIAEFFTGAEELERALAELDSVDLTTTQQEETIAGYFTLPAVERKPELEAKLDRAPMTAQARNATTEILRLAKEGKGNDGRTAYDVWNGATDYWTNGAGTGNKDRVSLSKRVFVSRFGGAADHKRDFSAYVMDSERRERGRQLGAKVLAAKKG